MQLALWSLIATLPSSPTKPAVAETLLTISPGLLVADTDVERGNVAVTAGRKLHLAGKLDVKHHHSLSPYIGLGGRAALGGRLGNGYSEGYGLLEPQLTLRTSNTEVVRGFLQFGAGVARYSQNTGGFLEPAIPIDKGWAPSGSASLGMRAGTTIGFVVQGGAQTIGYDDVELFIDLGVGVDW